MRSIHRLVRAGTVSAVAFGAALALTGPGSAATTTWNFSTTPGSLGTSMNFESGGVGVNVSAYNTSEIFKPGSSFTNGYIGSYSQGLGVSASRYDLSHAVDNFGHIDLIMFRFDQSISNISVQINSIPFFGMFGDTDFRWWSGNHDGELNLTGQTFSSLDGTLEHSGTNLGDAQSRSADLEGASGNYLIIAANPTQVITTARNSRGKLQTTTDWAWDDSFKVGWIKGTTEEPNEGPPPVGVPGPIAGAGLPALIAAGALLWRQRRRTVQPALLG